MSKVSEAQTMLLLLKGAVTELPQNERDAVAACAKKLHAEIAAYGEPGKIAASLVISELALIQARKDAGI